MSELVSKEILQPGSTREVLLTVPGGAGVIQEITWQVAQRTSQSFEFFGITAGRYIDATGADIPILIIPETDKNVALVIEPDWLSPDDLGNRNPARLARMAHDPTKQVMPKPVSPVLQVRRGAIHDKDVTWLTIINNTQAPYILHGRVFQPDYEAQIVGPHVVVEGRVREALTTINIADTRRQLNLSRHPSHTNFFEGSPEGGGYRIFLPQLYREHLASGK